MKTYEQYKASGVEWIGDIPAHWEVSKLKYVADITLGKMLCPEDKGGYSLKPYLKSKNIGRGKVIVDVVDEMWFSDKELADYLLKREDVLLSEGGEVGKTAMWQEELTECYIQNSVHRVRANEKNDPRFFFYLLTAVEASDYYKSLVSQVSIAHLTKEKLSGVPVIVPLPAEQTAIAQYLDRKTEEIDALLSAKETLLQKLAAKRAATINDAVTKGLDANAKMKDSGIEWLGEIPAHWEARKIARSFQTIGSGTTPPADQMDYYEDGNIPWINTGDLRDTILTESRKFVTEKALQDYSTLRMYPADSVIVAMYGATIGRAAITTFEGCTNQACCVLNDSPYFLNAFVFYWFLASKEMIVTLASGGGQPNISQAVIKELRMQAPPLAEQEKIVQYLNDKTAEFDDLSQKLKIQIEKLRAYRQSLITEVVTGKQRVSEN